MKLQLTTAICKYILSNFGVIKSVFFDSQAYNSLNTDEFLIDQTLVFEDDFGKEVKKNVWGCELTVSGKTISIILGDIGYDNQNSYCAVVQMQDAPAYAIFLDVVDNTAMICCTTDNNNWMICTTYLEATFLAAMEQLRESGLPFHKMKNSKQQFELLKSFIKHYDSYQEAANER